MELAGAFPGRICRFLPPTRSFLSQEKDFARIPAECIKFLRMDDDQFELPEVWDEYQWERFLQQQDRNTEKYFHLMEKYMDHPDRDELIAAEMGWHLEASEDDEFRQLDELMAQEMAEQIESGEGEFSDFFSSSPLYQDIVELNRWIDDASERHPRLEEQKDFSEFCSLVSMCGAKIAAALSQEDEEEIELGMVIAYLKRGLKAVNDALALCSSFARKKDLTPQEVSELSTLLFGVRNQVVDLMKEYRSEWQRLYGNGN